MKLTPELELLWRDYQKAEEDRIRSETLERLDVFISRLLAEPPALWRKWALDLAESISDAGNELIIRFPLFRHVLLPALVEGVTEKRAGCARWLAHFEQLLLKSDASPLPSELRTAHGLLQEALRVDSNDKLARQRLVERHARYLDYTLHELPAGVLYGHDGATAEECVELQAFLSEFRTHLEFLGLIERYQDLLAACEFHFTAYHRYLVAGTGDSYENFLKPRPGH
ncbi:MAG: hypothetical protein ACN0LA_06055 [Candidatus Longimicrobiales bacterium M2_2A_002]